MNNGDRVTGVPSVDEMREKYPTVTGYLSVDQFEFMGETHTVKFVMVDDVAVSCDKIRPAKRREEETVLS